LFVIHIFILFLVVAFLWYDQYISIQLPLCHTLQRQQIALHFYFFT
jgi:hypothetical protein